MSRSILCLLSNDAWKSTVDQSTEKEDFDIEFVNTAQEARYATQNGAFDAFLLDTKPVRGEAADLLQAALATERNLPIALIMGNDLERDFCYLNSFQIGIALPRVDIPDSQELSRILNSLADPRHSIGLENHMEAGTAIEGKFIRSIDDKMHIANRAISAAEQSGIFSSFDVQLVFEELINNSIVHAFHNAQGDEEVRLLNNGVLGENESIEARFAIDSRSFGISVRDNQGSLNVSKAINSIYRQCSLAGLTDESGRGLYISLMIGSKLTICLLPGEATEVVAIFKAGARKSEKTLCIFDNR